MAIPRDALQCQIHDPHSPEAKLCSLWAHQHLWGPYLFDSLFLTPLAPFWVQRDHIIPPRQQQALQGFQGTCRSFYSKETFCENIWNLHITKHRLLSGFRKRGGFSHQFKKVILGQTIRNYPFRSEKWSNTGIFRWLHLIHLAPLERFGPTHISHTLKQKQPVLFLKVLLLTSTYHNM